jgi:hypothetical protein
VETFGFSVVHQKGHTCNRGIYSRGFMTRGERVRCNVEGARRERFNVRVQWSVGEDRRRG